MKNDELANVYLGIKMSGRFKVLPADDHRVKATVKSTMPRILTFLDAQPGGSHGKRGGIGSQQRRPSVVFAAMATSGKRNADEI